MTRFLFLGLAMCSAAFLPGCDETSKACFDEADKPVKTRVSACGELCEKEDGKACAKQDELANPACFEKDDAEICRWMCLYSTTGKDLYCKKYEEITGEAPL